MKIKIDVTVLIVSLLFFIPGFAMIWYASGFWCALGVALVGIGASVKRTKSE